MPELCRFYGIIIRMHIPDHEPPHFHATDEPWITLTKDFSVGKPERVRYNQGVRGGCR